MQLIGQSREISPFAHLVYGSRPLLVRLQPSTLLCGERSAVKQSVSMAS